MVLFSCIFLAFSDDRIVHLIIVDVYPSHCLSLLSDLGMFAHCIIFFTKKLIVSSLSGSIPGIYLPGIFVGYEKKGCGKKLMLHLDL